MTGEDVDGFWGAVGGAAAAIGTCIAGVVLLFSAPIVGLVLLFTPAGIAPVIGVGKLVERRARRKRLERGEE